MYYSHQRHVSKISTPSSTIARVGRLSKESCHVTGQGDGNNSVVHSGTCSGLSSSKVVLHFQTLSGPVGVGGFKLLKRFEHTHRLFPEVSCACPFLYKQHFLCLELLILLFLICCKHLVQVDVYICHTCILAGLSCVRGPKLGEFQALHNFLLHLCQVVMHSLHAILLHHHASQTTNIIFSHACSPRSPRCPCP
jgi:hypothetical protein